MNKGIVAALAFASSTALAMPALAAPFEGPYVGMQAGLNRDAVGRPGTKFGPVAIDHGRNSFAGGVFAGYDYSIAPRVVVGAEAGLTFAANDAIDGSAGSAPAVIDPKRQIDLSGRAGYLVTRDTLVYVRGGYANVRARTTIGAKAEAISRGSDLQGWTLGAGTERSLTSTVSARVEYRYADLGESHGRFDRHQVLVGLAYHF